MLSFLDEKPHVTMGDLYLLSRFLFNLSSAVRQAVKKDLATLNEPSREVRSAARIDTQLLCDQAPSIIDQWAAILQQALATPKEQPQPHEEQQALENDGAEPGEPRPKPPSEPKAVMGGGPKGGRGR